MKCFLSGLLAKCRNVFLLSISSHIVGILRESAFNNLLIGIIMRGCVGSAGADAKFELAIDRRLVKVPRLQSRRARGDCCRAPGQFFRRCVLRNHSSQSMTRRWMSTTMSKLQPSSVVRITATLRPPHERGTRTIQVVSVSRTDH